MADVSLVRRDYRGMASLAIEYGAVLVTYPARLVVRTSLRSVYVAAGVGSLIFPPGAPVDGLILARPEWVDGCVPSEYRKPERVGEGGVVEASLPIIGLDIRDPVALFANGLEEPGRIRQAVSEALPPLVVDSEKRPVVLVSGDDYLTTAEDGPLADAVDYMAGLYSGCGGR